MTQSIQDAFQIAREIEALMGELLERLDVFAEDESLTTQRRHLAIKQVCSLFETRTKSIEKYAKDFLEEKVEKCAKTTVEGFSLGEDDELFVSGMVYDYKPVHKIEILNKDDRSWGMMIKALVDAGYASAIQKRLTVSHFVGPNGRAALEACAGLVECSTDGQWSITKPKAPNPMFDAKKTKRK